MANQIVIKHRVGTTGEPTLQQGEIAVNLFDKTAFIGTGSGNLLFLDKTQIEALIAGSSSTPVLATQAQAEAGTENTTTMTPLRVAQAIAQLANGLNNNYNAVVDPQVTDDASSGYAVGSIWINTSSDESYRCVDSTNGSAVWVKTTLQATDLSAVATSGDSDDVSEGTTNLFLTTSERTTISNALTSSSNIDGGTF